MVKSFAGPDKAASACPAGQTPDEDGVCQARKDTRGFSLPTRAAPAAKGPAAPAPGVRTVATTSAAIQRPVRAVEGAHRDLLITFKLGSAELTEQAKANARVFAQATNAPQLSSLHFEIEGHTDVTGSDALNQRLSQERAEAVKAFLVAQGVDASRLQAAGYGSSHLAVASDPKSAANRRVEARRLD